MINFDEFSKVEIRVGTIKNCEKLEKSEKLFKLDVNFGELGSRVILTGLVPYYSADELNGLQTLFVYNLEPRKMMGLESQGMIMTVGMDHTQKPELIRLSGQATNGDGVC